MDVPGGEVGGFEMLGRPSFPPTGYGTSVQVRLDTKPRRVPERHRERVLERV